MSETSSFILYAAKGIGEVVGMAEMASGELTFSENGYCAAITRGSLLTCHSVAKIRRFSQSLSTFHQKPIS